MKGIRGKRPTYRRTNEAAAAFTPRPVAVMLVTEARGTDESNSPKRVPCAGRRCLWFEKAIVLVGKNDNPLVFCV